MFVKWFIWKN